MTVNKKYRVFLVDDHPIVRDGIVRLIELGDNMYVCCQTGDGHEVMSLMAQYPPDVVILDLSLESADGFSLIGQLNSKYPKTPILILSMHDESTHALRCIKAGARGYLMKKCASTEIIKALNDVLRGNIYVSEAVNKQILQTIKSPAPKTCNSIENLSPKEFQIFRLYGRGLQTSQIASAIQCSPKTVETHCLRIRRKLNLHSLNELIAVAGAYFSSTPVFEPANRSLST